MSETKPEPADAPEGQSTTVMPDDSPGFALAERAVWHLLEKMGEDPTILDLRGRSDVCDFYVVCSGRSDSQVNALAKHAHNMLVAAGHKPKGLEGINSGRWALLDFFDVVVHIFKTDAREYFKLEQLWADAPRLDLEPAYFTSADVIARHSDLNLTPASGPNETA